jgi:4-amino-4-deoxy-L-arabinose transferase-like glycosyltransferase
MGKRQKMLLLGVILLFGLLLRIPQLGFPTIGYHNMKENEYLSMAVTMAASGNYVSRDVYFYNAFPGISPLGLYPQLPLPAYQSVLSYKLFGDWLWFARLINIFYMLGAIVILYFIAMRLTASTACAFSAAFLLAVLPLPVFFSRNLQPESPAFFLMTLGAFFWLKFLDKFGRRELLICAVWFAFAGAVKLSFLGALLPLFLVVPFSRWLAEKKLIGVLQDCCLFVGPFLLLFLSYLVTRQLNFSTMHGRTDLLEIFTSKYWVDFGGIIRFYAVSENFGLIYTLLFVLGVGLSWLRFRTDKSLWALLLRAFIPGVIPYMMLFSDFINQHCYYQMPFLVFFVMGVVYAVKQITEFAASRLKAARPDLLFIAVFSILAVAAAPGVKTNIERQFAFMIPAGDVMGDLIRADTASDEKFFIFTNAQGYAPCVYARRRCGWPDTLEQFKELEAAGVRFVIVNPIGMFGAMKADIREHINSNYHIHSAALFPNGSKMIATSVILKKGGRVDFEKFMKDNSPNLALRKVYRTIMGEMPLFVVKGKE